MSLSQHKLSNLILSTACAAAMLLQSGCSTLSSLGLPVAASTNQMIDSAKHISEAPGQALQLPTELTQQPLANYFVEVGDTVFVEAVSFDANIRLPGDQIVKPDGSISIGEFGNFNAANKTTEQIQLEIQALINSKVRSALEQEFAEETVREQKYEETAERPELESSDDEEDELDDSISEREQERRAALDLRIAEQIKRNKVSVRLVNWESKKIYVLGEVNSPGFFGYTGHQTVLDAIVEAGGLTSKANHHQIIVARPSSCGSCRTVMKVCYDQIVQLGDTSTNYQLMPGDRVFVSNLTFIDDLKKAFCWNKDPSCPRCAPCQKGCDLPTGCQ